MFIFTMGDVVGLVMLAAVVVFGIGATIFSAYYNRQDKESKKEAPKKKPEPKKQAPWYLVLAATIIFIAICLICSK